jgi:hypothetical protein
MTIVETAERKSRARALAYYFIALMILTLSVFRPSPDNVDFFRGMWLGLTATASLSLLPYARFLKPHSAVARLLDDEGARDHRRMAMTAGFWAALAASFGAYLAAEFGADLGGVQAARTIATAAMVAALVSFATLELRAQA